MELKEDLFYDIIVKYSLCDILSKDQTNYKLVYYNNLDNNDINVLRQFKEHYEDNIIKLIMSLDTYKGYLEMNYFKKHLKDYTDRYYNEYQNLEKKVNYYDTLVRRYDDDEKKDEFQKKADYNTHEKRIIYSKREIICEYFNCVQDIIRKIDEYYEEKVRLKCHYGIE